MDQTERRFGLRGAKADGLPAATDLMIVDQSLTLVELLSARMVQHGHVVTGCSDPEEAIQTARERAQDPPDVVLVGLVFPDATLNGLDVLLAFKKWCPESALIAYTAAEPQEARLLRVVWDSIHPASALSKLAPLATLIETVEIVRAHGRCDVDPMLRSLIPHQRSPWRTADGYRRLVPHAGHAKLWTVLLNHATAPTYKTIAADSKLSVNTIRNYRDDLLGELRLHGLDNPTMQEMHTFVHSVRPLLAPIVAERLANSEPRAAAAGIGRAATHRP